MCDIPAHEAFLEKFGQILQRSRIQILGGPTTRVEVNVLHLVPEFLHWCGLCVGPTLQAFPLTKVLLVCKCLCFRESAAADAHASS